MSSVATQSFAYPFNWIYKKVKRQSYNRNLNEPLLFSDDMENSMPNSMDNFDRYDLNSTPEDLSYLSFIPSMTNNYFADTVFTETPIDNHLQQSLDSGNSSYNENYFVPINEEVDLNQFDPISSEQELLSQLQNDPVEELFPSQLDPNFVPTDRMKLESPAEITPINTYSNRAHAYWNLTKHSMSDLVYTSTWNAYDSYDSINVPNQNRSQSTSYLNSQPISSCTLPNLGSFKPGRSVRISKSLNSIRTAKPVESGFLTSPPSRITKKVRHLGSKNKLNTSPLSQLDSRPPDDSGFINFDAMDAPIIMSAVAKSGNSRYK